MLTGQERLITLLTRSYWHPSRCTRLAEAVADLLSVSEARCAVAEAAVVNRKIADSRGRTIRHIKREILLRHLAELWRVNSPDDRHLAAAARDRGFRTLEEALNAARSFYLRHRLGIPNEKQARK